MRHVTAFEFADERPITALADVERWLVGDIVHKADTARAENAAVRNVDHVAAEILGRIEAFGLAVARIGATFLVRIVLQLALARLVANWTIERMVDEEHLEHSFAGVERLLGVHVDDLAFRHRRGAGWGQLGRLLDFYQTHAANAGHR